MARSMHSGGCIAIVVGLLAIALFATSWTSVEADDVPAFFLKIVKSIPRIGRSERFQEHYLKSARNAPRIGNDEGNASPSEITPVQADNEPFNGLTKRMINIPTPKVPNWSRFPLAIEGPPELWRTLAGYTNDRSGYGSDDVDNEIWQRDKRSGDVATVM